MKVPAMDISVNVFGEPLETCSHRPMTGFFRDGCCNTSEQDTGSHTVCIVATQQFLEYSRFRGNDLSTPMPEFGFPGLKVRITCLLFHLFTLWCQVVLFLYHHSHLVLEVNQNAYGSPLHISLKATP